MNHFLYHYSDGQISEHFENETEMDTTSGGQAKAAQSEESELNFQKKSGG